MLAVLLRRWFPRRSRRPLARAGYRPRLEGLEPRLAPAVLDVTGGSLTYTASAGVANNLQILNAGGNYTFNDTGEAITLTANAVAAGWTGGGNSVTGPTSSVTASVTVTGPLTVRASAPSRRLTLKSWVTLRTGPVTLLVPPPVQPAATAFGVRVIVSPVSVKVYELPDTPIVRSLATPAVAV